MTNKAPSRRWNTEHGGMGQQRRKGYPGKISHRTRLGAWWHILHLAWTRLRRGKGIAAVRRGLKLRPYQCRWGTTFREGETAPMHWHVGRRPAQK